jgi:prefoldin subunit 5
MMNRCITTIKTFLGELVVIERKNSLDEELKSLIEKLKEMEKNFHAALDYAAVYREKVKEEQKRSEALEKRSEALEKRCKELSAQVEFLTRDYQDLEEYVEATRKRANTLYEENTRLRQHELVRKQPRQTQ